MGALPHLLVGKFVGTGGSGTTCTSAAWSCSLVDRGDAALDDTIGQYASIAIDPVDGTPAVSYYDNENDNLMVATYAAGAGCDDAAWTCTVVDAAGDVGGGTSTAFAPDGTLWVAYREDTGGNVKLARRTAGAGCNVGSWTCEQVETATNAGNDPELAFDAAGHAWISHYDSTGTDLRVSRYVGAGGSNCVTTAWHCEQVTDGSDSGAWNELAFDPLGRPWIAYITGGTDIGVATTNRGGEILASSGSAGSDNATVSESHTDMTSVTDTSARDTANCETGNWNNGRWFESEEGGRFSLADGSSTAQCTEVAFTLDTSSANPDTTYRFAVATRDSWRPDEASWRGPVTINQYPTLGIAAATTLRAAKDAMARLTNCTDSDWGCAAIDTSSADVGDFPSIAFDGAGTPWISYFDDANDDLKIARLTGSASGACGSGWTCSIIDPDVVITHVTAMAIDPGGKPWIAYRDGTSQRSDLKVARYVGSGGTGCATAEWHCVTIDATSDVGIDPSIAIDDRGVAWVSFRLGAAPNDLRVARFVGTGGSCTGSAEWDCASVHTASDSGTGTSIAIDPHGNPWVSFRYVTGSDLYVARFVGAGGTGCAVASWTCEAIDTAVDGGSATSLAFDPSGTPWISYRDIANTDLKVARYVGAGGTTCANSAWDCQTVHDREDAGNNSSLAFDASDLPWIAFREEAGDDLELARYVGEGGSGCKSGVTAWTCSEVSIAGDRGKVPSLAFDSSGTPWIAFFDETNDDLGVAKLHLPPGRLSADAGFAHPGDSARRGDARYPLHDGDSPRSNDTTCSAAGTSHGYCGIASDGSQYDEVVAASNETPLFTFSAKLNNDYQRPTATWIGRSSVAPSSAAIRLEVFNGVTNRWEAVTYSTSSCITTAAATDCTMAGAPSGALSEYLDVSSGSAWVHFRIRQDFNTGAMTLSSDAFTFAQGSPSTAPVLAQNGYVFENDDEDEVPGDPVDDNTQHAAANAAITGVAVGERLTVRAQITNTGGQSQGRDLGLFYDRSDGYWTKVEGRQPLPSAGTACTDAAFTCGLVDDTTAEVGKSSGVAIDPSGTPWVAYWDSTSRALKVAHYVGTGGSCGASTSWTCTTVDSLGAGTFSNTGLELAFDGAGRPWVAYPDIAATTLKVAHYVGGGGNCGTGSAWICERVDGSSSGKGTSLGYSPTTGMWLAYSDDTNGDLEVARYVGWSGSGCAVETWTCTEIDPTGLSGTDPSLAIDASGNPWVAHYDADVANQDLRIARYVATGGNCGAGNAWRCDVIDSTGNVGRYPSIAFAPDTKPWIAYRDETGSGLKVARYLASGNYTCGDGGWNCAVVDATGDSGHYASLAFDVAGRAWVAHFRNSTDDLRLARFTGGAGADCSDGGWTCSSPQETDDIGRHASLAFDALGRPWLTSFDNTSKDLKFATLNRRGEITMTAGRAGGDDDPLNESHTDMTTVSDTANRDDADCSTGGANWNSGTWVETSHARPFIPSGSVTAQCTEVAWAVDTGQATANTTYRFAIASRDGWLSDRGQWRGPTSISNVPTLTTAAATTLRVSKDTIRSFTSNCSGDASWGCADVQHLADSTGWNPSVAFAPSGAHYVAYRNSTTEDLRVARYVASSGDCDTAAWSCENVDSSANTGHNPSLAFTPYGEAWVTYRENVTGDSKLRLARRVGALGGVGTGCADADWTCTTIDSIGDTGYNSSLAIDSAGRAWIAYKESVMDDLRVARYVGTGGVGCDDPAWTCTTVYAYSSLAAASDVGSTPAIALDPAGNPSIAFVNTSGTDIGVARYVGANGTGCADAAWTCTLVHTSGTLGASNIAFGIDGTGAGWIAYRDTLTDTDIKIAHYVGGATGNCSDTAWECDTVTASDDPGLEPSIAFDAEGKPWIAYFEDANNDLEYLRYRGPGLGACGTGVWANEWECGVIDTAGTTGEGPSIAFDHSGVPWVNYLQSGDLHTAKMHRPLVFRYETLR